MQRKDNGCLLLLLLLQDNGAFFRCLLGLELLRFGAAAASAPGPESVPLQRLEAVHRLLVRDGTNVIDVIDVLEEVGDAGWAGGGLLGGTKACYKFPIREGGT